LEHAEVEAIGRQAAAAAGRMDQLSQEIGKVIVGQSQLVRSLLIAMLTNGHVLLEGVPGLAKTLAVRTLADAISARFQRLQFTPDLLPSDLIGSVIYNQQAAEFVVRRGPIFANLVLADEINRAPAKVQSALLEAMQERQVTIGQQTHALPDPFVVLATQNPIEQEGTYPLPEAQVDRFMLKVIVGYPSRAEEIAIVTRMAGASEPKAEPVVDLGFIAEARETVRRIYVDERVTGYVVDVVTATRSVLGDRGAELVEYGASPRASIWLTHAAKSVAFLNQRGYVVPADVKEVARDVLRHRVIVTYEAEAEGITSDQIIHRALAAVKVP